MAKGKLFVLAGIDGSGKKTQANLLKERLIKEGHLVKLISFPRYGQNSSKAIECYLRGEFGTADEIDPYFASANYAHDRYKAAPQIRKWLEDGNIVICDRYISANKGHQGGKIKDKEEKDRFLEWLDELEFNIYKIPKPDAVILLHLPCKICQNLVDKKDSRDYLEGKKRDVHEDDINHLEDARQNYLYVAKKYDWKTIECCEEDGLLPIETIHEKIWAYVEKILK